MLSMKAQADFAGADSQAHAEDRLLVSQRVPGRGEQVWGSRWAVISSSACLAGRSWSLHVAPFRCAAYQAGFPVPGAGWGWVGAEGCGLGSGKDGGPVVQAPLSWGKDVTRTSKPSWRGAAAFLSLVLCSLGAGAGVVWPPHPGLLFDLKFVSDGVSFPFLPQYLGTSPLAPHLTVLSTAGVSRLLDCISAERSLWVLRSSRGSTIVCGLFWTLRARGRWAGGAAQGDRLQAWALRSLSWVFGLAQGWG